MNEFSVNQVIWGLAAAFALAAGVADWRWRRIPNWLTFPAAAIALILHIVAGSWPGAKSSLLGCALGLGILLPFVLIRALGGGDWKLVGGLGAFFGPARLIEVLIYTLLINAAMAVVLIVMKKRVGKTIGNLGHMAAALFHLRLPGPELTIDNPEAAKVPFGVAAALAVLLYTAWQHPWGGL